MNEEDCIKLIESKEKELAELSQKHNGEIQILENEIKDLKQKLGKEWKEEESPFD